MGAPLVLNGRDLQGTTTNRPSSPDQGEWFFDTTLNSWIVYNGTVWQNPANVTGSPATTSEFILESASDSLTATPSGTQGTSLLLVRQTNRVTTVANAADGVKLPPSVAGAELLVINHGANPMQVFPSSGDKIDDVTSATGVSQMSNSFVLYACATAGNWYTEGLATGFSGGFQTLSFADGLSANSGGVQSGATPITTMQARFTTVGGAGYSALLPAAAGGMALTIINAASTNAMNVFPAGTDQINGLGASNAYSLPAGSVLEIFTTVAGQWHTIVSRPSVLPAASFVTNTTTTTFAAGQLTGSDSVVYANTGNTPGTITTRTAAQMFADTPNAFVGQTWMLRIYHGGTGTLTVGVPGSVTLTGTATIATTTWRDFVCTFNTATTMTMQNVGSGTS